METKKLLRQLAKFYPKRNKESYDRVGLMMNELKVDTKKILLCLDFDDIVYNQISSFNDLDLIITHHPFIFGPKGKVLKSDKIKAALYEKLLKTKVPIYSFHTNFDAGLLGQGMNDALLEKIGATNIRGDARELSLRLGTLPRPMEVHEFAKMFKEIFSLPMVELLNYGTKEVKEVAIIGGGGSRRFELAKELGADIYISGDAPHHVRRDIVLNKLNYLNVYHEVEKIFMEKMKSVLLSIDPSLEVIIIDHEEYPEII